MKVAVTGATGYIGGRLVKALSSRDFNVLALSRKPVESSGRFEWAYYALELKSVELPQDVTCVVHLAMNLAIQSEGDLQCELESLNVLLQASQKISAKFIYISSQTASDNAVSFYGRAKRLAETIVINAGGCVVRPGMVYGAREQGLFGTISALLNKSPVYPIILPSPKVQPIHVDDLCCAISELCAHNTAGCYNLAESNPIPFHVLLQRMSQNRQSLVRIGLPFPALAISLFSSLLPGNAVLARLNSLCNLPIMDTKDDLTRLGVKPRLLVDGVSRSGRRRRRLLMEANVLFRYLGFSSKALFISRRYVYAVESMYEGSSLDLHWLLSANPWMLIFVESNIKIDKIIRDELQRRLTVASFIFEASPLGGQHYLRLHRANGIFSFLIGVAGAGMTEAIVRISNPLLSFITKKLLIGIVK